MEDVRNTVLNTFYNNVERRLNLLCSDKGIVDARVNFFRNYFNILNQVAFSNNPFKNENSTVNP